MKSVSTQAPYDSYYYRPACGNQIEATRGGSQPCGRRPDCAPDQTAYQLFGVQDGEPTPLGSTCTGGAAPAVAAAPPPQVTAAMVLNAFRQIPLPHPQAKTQPAGKTLINFDTIFYTDAPPLERDLMLLGQAVHLNITPSRFDWVHGDGTSASTPTAGAPYPAKDIVYRYSHAHTTVQQRVDIIWSARWSLNGGPLQDVAGTVTTAGPDTPLRIAEASPELSGAGH